MNKKKFTRNTLFACILAISTAGGAASFLAAQPKTISAEPAIYYGFGITGEKSYENTDSAEIKNKNANITVQEAEAAKEERLVPEEDLGYTHDKIIVCYDRKKAAEAAQEQNLESEWKLYQKYLHEHGDDAFNTFANYILEDTVTLFININDNKTVKTAVQEYCKLDTILEAKPISTTTDPDLAPLKLHGIKPAFNNDSVDLRCISQNAYKNTMFRWECCKIGTSEWQLVSDWNYSSQCTWYPDANEEYAVVCKASYNGNEFIDAETVWYVSRPQMKKSINGRCAMPTADGILFGCTSTVDTNDFGYLTTCYIWSFDQQAWITKSSYEASNCAWFQSSGLAKGTYMMYNCTEQRMPDGTLRKLSCDYYLFTL